MFNNVLLRLLKGVATDVNCLSNSGQEGGEHATWAGLQDCETDHHAVDRRMLCSWCSADRPLSFTSMSAIARQSRVQATLACTTTVYPYFSPVSPDVDVCCVAGWWLMFEIMRTRCLSSGRHTIADNIVSGVLPTKIMGLYRYDPIWQISPSTQYPSTSIVRTLLWMCDRDR